MGSAKSGQSFSQIYGVVFLQLDIAFVLTAKYLIKNYSLCMHNQKVSGHTFSIKFETPFIFYWLEFLGEEEPDVSVPVQISEDMVDDDISSR